MTYYREAWLAPFVRGFKDGTCYGRVWVTFDDKGWTFRWSWERADVRSRVAPLAAERYGDRAYEMGLRVGSVALREYKRRQAKTPSRVI